MSFLRRTKRERPWEIGRVWQMENHRGWGNRISWRDFEARKIDGHTTPVLRVDDEVRCRMESGRVARYRVASVEYAHGVSDMWWATLADVGYLDEFPTAPPVTPRSAFA